MTDTNTAEAALIHLAPGQVVHSLTLRTSSALLHCTNVKSDSSASPYIVALWPRLSSGESLLWRVLAWLNGDGGLPSDEDLAAGLDLANLVAARAAVRAGGGA